jgi:hypothetical protein
VVGDKIRGLISINPGPKADYRMSVFTWHCVPNNSTRLMAYVDLKI